MKTYDEMLKSLRKSHHTDRVDDPSTLTRKDLVERLWKYVWFKDPDDNLFSLAGELKQLETADESTARRICDNLENVQKIHCEAGPLANCVEWVALRRKVGVPSEKWG
jgi:hypothetical protein